VSVHLDDRHSSSLSAEKSYNALRGAQAKAVYLVVNGIRYAAQRQLPDDQSLQDHAVSQANPSGLCDGQGHQARGQVRERHEACRLKSAL
jgi:hypothetical protein